MRNDRGVNGTPDQPTAVAVAAAVRSGQRTARSVLDDCLGRIAEIDPELGAFQTVLADEARARAADIDEQIDSGHDSLRDLPLLGVPVAVKDNVQLAGRPTRHGSAATGAAPNAADHPVVERLRSAGAVIVGTTRVPELSTFGTTDSVYGVTRNPWDLSRTPGGSSGGSAAAVAAGMVTVAHGTDGFGSIRIPAACCGLVGLKPGHGVVPAQSGIGSWYSMSENGALATTVADAALMFSVLAGRPDAATVSQPAAGLRIALTGNAPMPGTPVDPEFRRAVQQLAPVLREAGHLPTETKMPYRLSAGGSAFARWVAMTAADAELVADRDRLERRNAVHARLGSMIRRSGFPHPAGAERWRAAATAFFADYDVLVTPAIARLPLAAARWGERGWAANVWSNTRFAPFAAPWNLAGWPALAVPVGLHSAGLPIDVQLVARPGGEQLLLSVAALIESRIGWQRVAPAFAR